MPMTTKSFGKSARATDGSWKAVETRAAIDAAMRTWERSFATGGVVLAGLGGKVVWHERESLWGHFRSTRGTPLADAKRWNAFGQIPIDFAGNMMVQINPPVAGIDTDVQGMVAIAANGDRWVLHGRRLHPSRKRISADEFLAASPGMVQSVAFSDGSTAEYRPVANLDGDPADLIAATAEFVAECGKVRRHYLGGGGDDGLVRDAEASTPELRGDYTTGPRGSATARRIHADVWHALTRALTARGQKHTNSRVGAYGPDLRTTGDPRVLFEIKTSAQAHDAYEGLGQLLLYEKLLLKKFRKVLILPTRPQPTLEKALSGLGVEVMTYTRTGRLIRIPDAGLAYSRAYVQGPGYRRSSPTRSGPVSRKWSMYSASMRSTATLTSTSVSRETSWRPRSQPHSTTASHKTSSPTP